MKILILTVGLPRSGKSTWAKAQNCPLVNPDSVRLALHGQAFLSQAEDMVWTMSRYLVKALFIAGHDVVIVDATNTTRKRRAAWKGEGWRREYEIFEADKEECIHRARLSDRVDLIPVIERMAEEFEPVERDEWDSWSEHSDHWRRAVPIKKDE